MASNVNLITTTTGKLRPVCEFCGRLGRAVEPDERGRIDVWELGRGWSIAPHAPDFRHRDGSTGDQFACPGCNALRKSGQRLRSRGEADAAQISIRLREAAQSTYRLPVPVRSRWAVPVSAPR